MGREEPLLHVAGVGSEEVTQEGLGAVPSTQQTRRHTAWLQVVGCVSLAHSSSLDFHAGLRRTWEKDPVSWETSDLRSRDPGSPGDLVDFWAVCNGSSSPLAQKVP